ncbi:MAG TPA: RNA polymerase sigma factor [Chitinophagales bacterium]|nr:RNA polymerase sigma factor [Chitinophagales bacterium]HMW94776.1 RNA polymerase sigma factor [Chitinophagales bacterium]HMY42694.1 RNA polymerase sigma factor [Chitinophagales bacterium]HMZ94266.1 RNA polymerase sigma factor [Chitinophagales bacterium]HNB39248.1 RNA polymerase sigma factor [Chitinophagales bacterium]
MDKIDKSDIFLSVVQTNKGIIYKVVNSYCQNIEDRKDLVQEIIIQLWKSFDNYDDNFKHSTWMYRISLNVAISFYRKENRRKKISNPLIDGIINFSDNDDFEDKETDLGILQQMISQLKDLDKALILLYLEEKSYKEISQIIGISETNVATKINRIKNSLKQKFTQLKNQ